MGYGRDVAETFDTVHSFEPSLRDRVAANLAQFLLGDLRQVTPGQLDASRSGDDDSFDSISNFHGAFFTGLALGELYEIDGRFAFAAHVHESHIGAESNNRSFDRITFVQR